MNISFNWLKEYVEMGDMTPEQLDDLLTDSPLPLSAEGLFQEIPLNTEQYKLYERRETP